MSPWYLDIIPAELYFNGYSCTYYPASVISPRVANMAWLSIGPQCMGMVRTHLANVYLLNVRHRKFQYAKCISQWAVYVDLCAEKYYVIVMITCQVLHTVSYFLSLKGFLEILFYYSNYCHHTKYYTLWDIFCILSCNGYLQIPPLWDRTVFSVM